MSKVVLITGASSGIGKTIGEYLIEKKFKVYGTCRNPLNYPNSIIELIKSNINSIDEIDNCISYIKNKEERIDVLINNAGIGFTGPIEEADLEDVEKLFNTNFFGPLEMIKKVLPIMRKNNGGLIINITSIAGYFGLPFRGIYSASKSALEIVTESLRMEVRNFNIKITNIAPGVFKTDIVNRRIDSFNDKKSLYFSDYYRLWKNNNEHIEKSGSNPKMIALLVNKIINTKNPKIHYVVGNRFQKFSIILKRLLPDLIFEKILTKYYKL